jgi:type II secretory pathway pseudopilin PulG
VAANPTPAAGQRTSEFEATNETERNVAHALRDERGITIIETTVILSILFILAGAMSPIVSESVTTARAVRAKNDANMIAMGLINLQKDLGGDALAFSAVALAQPLRLPDVLATEGQTPAVEDLDAKTEPNGLELLSPANRGPDPLLETPDGSSRAQRRRWHEAVAGGLDDHLTTNRIGYRYRRPGEYGGWNGPYVSAPVKGDPWGKQYLVNTQFLDGGSTAADASGRPRRAVFVVSSGANGIIETPYEQPITDARAYGDDIVVRIQ